MNRSDRLLSWIGVTDYEHFVGKKAGSPLVGVAQSVRPHKIDLLWGDSGKTPLQAADKYPRWLKQQLRNAAPNVQITLHRIPDSSERVMDFGWIFGCIERYIADFDAGDIAVNASSGTSMMTAAWIVWAKTARVSEVRLFVSSAEQGVEPLALPPGLDINLHRLLAIRKDDPLLERVVAEWTPPKTLNDFLGSSIAMKAVLYRIERIAPFPVPVLLCGEPGTGKSVLARKLHQLQHGNGKDSKFVVVDCGQLFGETEVHHVFGWKRGAFTGAVDDNPGLIAGAQDGTLFLDEVGNAPTEIQANLLRILQERKYRRLGSLEEQDCTARVVAATNAHLHDLVRGERFRQDLLDRLSGIVIKIPPLRERETDVVETALKKLEVFQCEPRNSAAMEAAGIKKKALSEDARRELKRYDWPGNVRQLEHVIARLVVLGDPASDVIEAEDVRRAVGDSSSLGASNLLNHEVGAEFKLDELVLQLQEHYVKIAARRAQGNQTEMARLLGFGSSRTPLRTILKGLERAGRPIRFGT